jgi:excisionase family DNA binding protein
MNFMHDATLESSTYPALLKPQDVAQRLKISRAMAYKLLTLGELPTVRIGRIVRVREADLEAYIQKCWTGWK